MWLHFMTVRKVYRFYIVLTLLMKFSAIHKRGSTEGISVDRRKCVRFGRLECSSKRVTNKKNWRCKATFWETSQGFSDNWSVLENLHRTRGKFLIWLTWIVKSVLHDVSLAHRISDLFFLTIGFFCVDESKKFRQSGKGKNKPVF